MLALVITIVAAPPGIIRVESQRRSSLLRFLLHDVAEALAVERGLRLRSVSATVILSPSTAAAAAAVELKLKPLIFRLSHALRRL
jgi:hypothetical protein